MSRSLRHPLVRGFLIALLCSPGSFLWAQNSEIPPGKVFAEAQVASNRTEAGLTQTDGAPSVMATLGYRWPQFTVGLWGANYKNDALTSDVVNIRIFMAYKFIITSAVDLTVRYDLNQYYNAGSANGSVTTVDFNYHSYHGLLQQFDNWEGTEDQMLRIAGRKEFEIPSQSLWWPIEAAYNMPKAEGSSGYFDIRTGIAYKIDELRFELGLTLTSDSSQLNERGKPSAYILFAVTP